MSRPVKSSEPFVISPTDPAHSSLLPSLVSLHTRCIQVDKCLMRFHPPFDEAKTAKMLAFWEGRVEEARKGSRIIWVTTSPDIRSGGDRFEREEGEVVVTGVVSLSMMEAETVYFRGEVEVFMVHPDHRKEGLGRKLMRSLEAEAVKRGRTLLMLSTTKDTTAELYAYPRMGYIKFGVLPNYGASPEDSRLVDGVFMYKDLRLLPPLK